MAQGSQLFYISTDTVCGARLSFSQDIKSVVEIGKVLDYLYIVYMLYTCAYMNSTECEQ